MPLYNNPKEMTMAEILDESRMDYATETYYKSRIAELETKVSGLESQYKSANEIATSFRNRLENAKAEVKEFVTNNFDSHVTNDDLIELAETFDISMTRQVSFTVSVTFNCTAEVPFDTDLDDLESLIDGDLTASLDCIGSEFDNFEYDYPELRIEDVEVM